MKVIQKIGLGIFLGGILTLFSILTLGEYKLSKEVIEHEYLGTQTDVDLLRVKAVLNSASNTGMLDKVYYNQFTFNADLYTVINNANSTILNLKGLGGKVIEQIKSGAIVNGKVNYNEALVRSLVTDPEKKQLLADNTGWMYGREFNSPEEFTAQFEGKMNDVNRSVISGSGIKENSGTWFSITKKSSQGFLINNAGLLAILCFVVSSLGALMYIVPQVNDGPAGIKNNGIFLHAATNKGWIGVIVGTLLILFYIVLYWYPQYIANWVILVDPLYGFISGGGSASQWFLYGILYCLAMTVMGVRMIIKYRHNKYQIIRTLSVIGFQIGFAFLIPEIMMRLNDGASWAWVDLKNMWPLDYDFFNNGGLVNYAKEEGGKLVGPSINGGKIGLSILIWGIALFVIGVPLMVYFFGKRWYCSWVCGCGGLAETLGDPYRHLSDKSLKAWKIERWMIHSVLAFSIIMTVVSLYTMFTGVWQVFGVETSTIQKTYGFLIGSVFSGVVGTGFYPLMGNRMWCRFGCPLAAYLGLVQRYKSRFRITTNGGQCISCGNCSTYCEQGIDVRAYAQKGQNIVRSSCVGCGVCSAVCPRGVLKLENGPEDKRISNDNPIVIGNNGVSINDNLGIS